MARLTDFIFILATIGLVAAGIGLLIMENEQALTTFVYNVRINNTLVEKITKVLNK